MFKRLVEIMIGLLALTIAGFTFWACYDVLVHPPESGASQTTIWATVYVLAFVAAAAVVFGARLLVPRWRVEGGRIIGVKGLVAFLIMYSVMLVVAVIVGSGSKATILPPLLVLAAAGFLLWQRFRGTSAQ